MTQAVAERVTEGRTTPVVVQVPPPDGTSFILDGALGGFVGLGAALGILIGPLGSRIDFLLMLAAVVGGIGLIGRGFWRWRAATRERRAWIATRAGWDADPLAAKLASMWKVTFKPPSLKEVRHAVRDECRVVGPACVALGLYEIPPSREYRFEPVALTPGKLHGHPDLLIAVSLFLFLMLTGVFFEFFDLMPEWAEQYWAVPAVGIPALVLVCWRLALRPAYLRVAPGCVQVLQYAVGSGKPSIREYRVAGEFLCIVHAGVDDYTLMLANEQHEDRFLLKKKDGDELLRPFWEAVLSTAPTPPLSDEHVAG